ncbi:hypothetical protein [Sphingobium lignivorans]|uniref:Threonine dehydrogenase-like Zn-dependent dehydrogenase n=1 Tax=Sphingobium lignivorans TaxID=2735886 RepID=A0ABR6NG11_9SPHN|nr:hypothetical protein [Sphingobium lignivorans]MBB5986208.1 threonine dehydrogenase-like Zn-dependent dehydrogenase [Sphingobium lignivorans]
MSVVFGCGAMVEGAGADSVGPGAVGLVAGVGFIGASVVCAWSTAGAAAIRAAIARDEVNLVDLDIIYSCSSEVNRCLHRRS